MESCNEKAWRSRLADCVHGTGLWDGVIGCLGTRLELEEMIGEQV